MKKMSKAGLMLVLLFSTTILFADDGWGGGGATTECTSGATKACSNQCGRGIQQCIEGVWSGCSAGDALSEVCDGKDNDCDGQTDEGNICTSCANINCGNGSCEISGGQPFCNCNAGFHAERLSCVANEYEADGWGGNGCNEKSCSGNGTCEKVKGKAFCNCKPGYHADIYDCVPNEAAPATDCPNIVAGMNENFMVDGDERKFLVHLPDAARLASPVSLIFNWHGLDDTAENIANYTILKYLVNDETMPFILVSPEDLELEHPAGVEWHNIDVTKESRDVRFFDKMLYCIQKQYDIKPEHIHIVGFSSGSIMTDLLMVTRGELIASAATYSGSYGSNSANGIPGAVWPELKTANHYTQLMVHGGAKDEVLISFSKNTENDSTYLRKRGHDTIVCNHNSGHQIPWDVLGGWHVLRFFEAHPLGTEYSPYNSGLPSYFPSYCKFRGKLVNYQ